MNESKKKDRYEDPVLVSELLEQVQICAGADCEASRSADKYQGQVRPMSGLRL